MNLYMATVDRSPHPNYLAETLRSLAASDHGFGKVLLCAGGPAVGHLGNLPEDVLTPKVPLCVHDCGADVRSHIDRQPDAPSRYAATMLNALMTQNDGAVCWSDDDLEFHPRFFEFLRAASTALRFDVFPRDGQFVLSLFSAGATRCPAWPPEDDDDWYQEEVAPFGSLFLCFAGGCAGPLVRRGYELHLLHRRQNPWHGMDLCLREAARSLRIPWYVTTWSLVQHIGHISSGCTGVETQVYSPVYLGDQAGAGDR